MEEQKKEGGTEVKDEFIIKYKINQGKWCVFVIILGSVSRWRCELLSNFLPLLKGLRGEGEVSQDSW